jgi:hypothetical protein
MCRTEVRIGWASEQRGTLIAATLALRETKSALSVDKLFYREIIRWLLAWVALSRAADWMS